MPLNSRIFEIPRRLLNKKNGFAIDFGSTLIKVVYISEKDDEHCKGDSVTICMESFLLDQLDEALDLIKKEVTLISGGTYLVTGVQAAFKTELIEEKLNIKISVCMEFKAIIAGFRFMETNFPEESYTLPSDPPYMKGIEAYYTNIKMFQEAGGGLPVSWDDDETFSDSTMMFLLGSVAGLMKINPDDTHCIVDSTYNAGQTLLGLGRILTGAKSLEELMSLASAGDLSNVHMCFNDLLDSMTGSTGAEDKPGKDGVIFQFAKAMRKDHADFKKEDLAIALLHSQVDHFVKFGYMSCNLHKVKKVYVFGSMIEGSEVLRTEFKKLWEIHTNLRSYRPVEMKIMKYSGYLGAIGALVTESGADDFKDTMEAIASNR